MTQKGSISKFHFQAPSLMSTSRFDNNQTKLPHAVYEFSNDLSRYSCPFLQQSAHNFTDVVGVIPVVMYAMFRVLRPTSSVEIFTDTAIRQIKIKYRLVSENEFVATMSCQVAVMTCTKSTVRCDDVDVNAFIRTSNTQNSGEQIFSITIRKCSCCMPEAFNKFGSDQDAMT